MRALPPFETVCAIPLPIWDGLFHAFAFHPLPDDIALSHEHISEALATKDVPLPLARALFTVVAFTIEAARSEVFAAARAVGFPTETFRDSESPAALIAGLLAQAESDARVREVVDAAKIIRDRAFRPRMTQIYYGLPTERGASGPSRDTTRPSARRPNVGARPLGLRRSRACVQSPVAPTTNTRSRTKHAA